MINRHLPNPNGPADVSARQRRLQLLSAFVPRIVVVIACTTTLVGGAACGATGRGFEASSPAASPSRAPSSSPTSTQGVVQPLKLSWSEPGVISDTGALLDVVTWRDGYVAVGQATDGGQIVGAAFASSDGAQWRRTTTASTFSSVPVHVVATASQLIAVANGAGSPPSADGWVSIDGQTWKPQPGLHLAAGAITALAARADTIVAVGYDADNHPGLWRADANLSWTPVPSLSAHAVPRNVVAITNGFLAIGREGQQDGAQGAGAPGAGVPAAWSSADGSVWSTVSVEGNAAAGAQLTDAFRVASGYLAIGSDDGNPTQSARSASLWSSTDARDWRLIGPPAHWGVAGADGRQIFVFTTGEGTATLTAWLSVDGRTWSQMQFTGDTADVPAFDAYEPDHVDRVFVQSRGIVVIGVRRGHPAAWLVQAQP